MNEFASYRARRAFLPVLLASYVAVALTSAPAGTIELFPFFSWSLFSRSLNERGDYTLVVRSVDGHPVNPPRFVYDMPERFQVVRTRDATLPKLIDKLVYFIRGKT